MCDLNWDDIDAGVVCRMHGFHFGTATHKSTFGDVKLPYYSLKCVRCSGEERNLLDCRHWEGGMACSGQKGAGVRCFMNTTEKNGVSPLNLN